MSGFNSFHLLAEREQSFVQSQVVTTTETRRWIRRKRDLAYDFTLHEHPYVEALLQRLLRRGTAGLQALDTEYVLRVALSSAPAKPLHLLSDNTLTRSDDGSVLRFAGRHLLTLADGRILANGLDTSITVTLPEGARLRNAAGEESALRAAAPAKLLDRLPRPRLYEEIFDSLRYDPTALVRTAPVMDLDFDAGGAYAVYNWELFFHVPLTLAMHLSKNQRHADAQRWFHLLFDPTDATDAPAPERYWKVLPFLSAQVHSAEQLLVNLAQGTQGNQPLRQATIRSIQDWMDRPFQPHAVARQRPQAYMLKTVMAYLDNLIAWGDSLFRQDTGQAIDEAQMLYVLAANLLGPRPQAVPKKGSVKPQTYAQLRGDLQLFGSVLRDVEPELPFDLLPAAPAGSSHNAAGDAVASMGRALYFCVPRNAKLLGYWDTVADRLFKIRNSLNLQGVFRQLALFEPPIDPALLARAAAAGLDTAAIVGGLNQPLPLVRFALLVQKAGEIVQEVKSLGQALLAAIEKEDGEAMALLRARHEKVVMQMAEQVRYAQWQEAVKAHEGLLASLAVVVQRYSYYEQQLGGKPEDIAKSIPVLDELDRASLEAMRLKTQEPGLSVRAIEVDIAEDLSGSAGHAISSHEQKELELLALAQGFQDAAAISDTLAGVLSAIPAIGVHATPMGVGGKVEFGGQHLHDIFSAASSAARGIAGRINFEASRAARTGNYARREQDLAFQSNAAAAEINQTFKQLRAAQIREAAAELELRNHRQQMRHADEMERFLNGDGSEPTGKRSNKALYAWMKREVKGLYAQSFQFAFDIARKAERALQHELGNPGASYLQFGYLAGKEGLLAGERLLLDIRRMEMAYHELNQREYELTKHVSLLQIDPRALIRLRRTGQCTISLPESLYDMDGPGHHFRRLKSVALSLPCVAGPYASVNCTLTLLRSSVRKSPMLGDGYPRADADDPRFDDHLGSVQTIVTSSAQNDSGLFETNLRDERYLPFEYSGAVGTWNLRLPADPRTGDPQAFDYASIADVVLHLRYTAREGGSALRTAAMADVRARLDAGEATGSTRLFSLRDEFPGEWAQWRQRAVADADGLFPLTLALRKEHYPLWSQGRLNLVKAVELWARNVATPAPARLTASVVAGSTFSLEAKEAVGGLFTGAATALPAAPTGELALRLSQRDLGDVWLSLTWAKT